MIHERVLEHIKLPFDGELHKYQKDDIDDLSIHDICGIYLDLGLGKTTVSAILATHKLITDECYTVHVLCPESLILQWVDVLTRMGLKTGS